MSLTVTLCSADRALLIADSASSVWGHGVARTDARKQWLLAGCVGLQCVGDQAAFLFCRDLAHRTDPLPLEAYFGAVWVAAMSLPTAPGHRPEECRAFDLVGLDRHGRLKLITVVFGQETGPAPIVRRADWSADPLLPFAMSTAGFHCLPNETVEARQEEIVRLPWPEAEAAARELFAAMAESNPGYVGGPISELRMTAAGCAAGGARRQPWSLRPSGSGTKP